VFVQRALGLKDIPCLDIPQQCTGFMGSRRCAVAAAVIAHAGRHRSRLRGLMQVAIDRGCEGSRRCAVAAAVIAHAGAPGFVDGLSGGGRRGAEGTSRTEISGPPRL
jgi:hypothetical protein